MSTLAIPMVASVLIGQIQSSALAAWSLLMVLEATADLVIARPRTERIASGAYDPTWRRRMLPHYVSFGAVWGSLPLFALVGGEPEPLWLAIVMVLAVLTVYVVTTAASRPLFAIGAGYLFAPALAADAALAWWLSHESSLPSRARPSWCDRSHRSGVTPRWAG